MPSKRIIACLDVKDARVVKGVRFEGHVDAGDPVELALRYRDEGADEIVIYDIAASAEERTIDYAWLAAVAFSVITLGATTSGSSTYRCARRSAAVAASR